MSNIELASVFNSEWDSGKQEFSIQTSGSTGQPKTIVLHRQWMTWSAEQTAQFLNPTTHDTILCCLPINKVGGLMQLVRAKVWGVGIKVIEPSANPLLLPSNCNIISLTPYQLHHVLSNEISIKNLSQFREVLIGGSDIADSVVRKINSLPFENTIFRHSYGMTETYSHIALRTLNGKNKSDWFTLFSDLKITQNENHCGVINLPFFNTPIITTDIIELLPNTQFKIIGRADNIINTGGVKIQPELIEKAIREHLNIDDNFYINSMPDNILGQKIVLIAEKSFNYNLTDLLFIKEKYPYAMPKEIIFVNKLERNEGGKVLRIRA